MKTTSIGEAKYFVIFIDDFSKKIWLYPIKVSVLTSSKSLKRCLRTHKGSRKRSTTKVSGSFSGLEGFAYL